MPAAACLVTPCGIESRNDFYHEGEFHNLWRQAFHNGGKATMNALRSSGFTTVMLWCIHVAANNGDLIYNDILVASNGVDVGDPAWLGQLATLNQQPTSVNRIEISVSS